MKNTLETINDAIADYLGLVKRDHKITITMRPELDLHPHIVNDNDQYCYLTYHKDRFMVSTSGSYLAPEEAQKFSKKLDNLSHIAIQMNKFMAELANADKPLLTGKFLMMAQEGKLAIYCSARFDPEKRAKLRRVIDEVAATADTSCLMKKDRFYHYGGGLERNQRHVWYSSENTTFLPYVKIDDLGLGTEPTIHEPTKKS